MSYPYSESVYLNLPFPPTINSYYVQTKGGRFISAKGRNFRKTVMEECNEQNALNYKYDGQVEFAVILFPSDKRLRDLDNYLKALQDALTHAKLWIDDSQINYIEVFRGHVVPGGHCKIRMRPYQGMIMPCDDNIWDYIE